MDFEEEARKLGVKFEEEVSLINFRFWQERTITKSVMNVQLYEAREKYLRQLLYWAYETALGCVGEDEVGTVTDIVVNSVKGEIRQALRKAFGGQDK